MKKTSSKNKVENDYLYQKTLDPLQNKYKRWKGDHWADKKSKRKEVTEILVPWMEDFVKTRLSWKKLNKMFCNDTRGILIQHFIGKSYPSHVLRNGKQTKTKIWYKPSAGGKLVMDTIKKEIQGFTETELVNTLINILYKNHIDHYSIKLKPFVNTRPDKNAISLWDKISENVQV